MKIEKKKLTKQDKLLVVNAVRGIRNKYKTQLLDPAFAKKIRERVEYELNTIINMGFSSYFLIVQDYAEIASGIGHMPDDRIRFLRENYRDMSCEQMKNYILDDQSCPGFTYGLGRGSAAGSIVVYALGITAIDPLEYDLYFERFLNPERVSMPDIDADFSKSEFEYGVRDIVLYYVCKKYGFDGVCGITTPSTLAAKAAIVNMARIYGCEKKNQKDAFLALGSKINALIPKTPGVQIEEYEDIIRETFGHNKDAMAILEMAKHAEGLNINFGRHACGNIIVDNGDVGEYAPLMWDTEEEQWKIELDAETAESLGYLKMDFLGLKNLNLITKICRDVYAHHGVFLDPLNLPEDAETYKTVFAAGRTQSVFQFESDGMKNTLKKFEPERFSDLILLVAVYRPGPLQYIDGIIRRKHGLDAPESSVTKIAAYHEPFRNIVAQTYYALVYQEQIMAVFRMVGYSMGGADNVRRAMGHKKADILQAEKQAFIYGDNKRSIAGAIAVGVKEDDAESLFEEMIEFAKYSFNKSHAACYARTAYITGYLKAHFPTEFYSAALNTAEQAKYPALINEAKNFSVTIHTPDLNKSSDTFAGRDGHIYFGLSSIKGMPASIGTEIVSKRPYTSIADFVIRTDGISETRFRDLVAAGTFDSLRPNRQAILTIAPDYYKYRKDIQKKKSEIQSAALMLEDLMETGSISREKWHITSKTLPTKEKLEQKIKEKGISIQESHEKINDLLLPVACTENLEDKLNKEKELLGLYVSGSPLDSYDLSKVTFIADLPEAEENKSKVLHRTCGIIRNLRETKRKKDGKDMAFFVLEDTSGSINVAVFTKSYEKVQPFLSEGSVVGLVGEKKEESRNENSEEKTYQFICDSAFNPTEKKVSWRVFLDDMRDWMDVQDRVKSCESSLGHPLYITFGLEDDKTFKYPRPVSDQIAMIFPDVTIE